jgi:putative transposase
MELALEKGWDILALEVAPDHVHLRKEFPHLLRLPSLWTSSYFVSTAGNISSETVKKYIEDPHHAAN